MARVRFAPSPTGMLHLGGARTALFNYLYAKNTGGSFVLRIEDTDKERVVPGSLKNLLTSLKWLGLNSDEGPSVGGKYGPYIQSERLPLYQQHASELVKTGHAYHCFCTKERLLSLRKKDGNSALKLGYDKCCRKLSSRLVEEKLSMGLPHTIRLKVPESGNTIISDAVYGQVDIVNSEIDDQVLLKSDGTPTYHLASVVDDHCMEISHVLRGEEWLLSTAKHLILYSAFQWAPPTYAHLPLLVSSSGAKLSKRNKDNFIESYKEKGFYPEAIVNFIAGGRLAQRGALDQKTADTEMLINIEELAQSFSLERINKNPTVIDETTLSWINRLCHKKRLSSETQLHEMAVQLKSEVCRMLNTEVSTDLDYFKKVLLLLEDRIHLIPDIASNASYFWMAPDDIRTKILELSQIEDKAQCLMTVKESLALCNFESFDALSTAIRESAVQLGLPTKQLMLLTRLAITGTKATPGLAAVMELIGKEEVLNRLENTLNLVQS